MHCLAIFIGTEDFIKHVVHKGSKFPVVLRVWFLPGTGPWQLVVQDQQPGLLQLGWFPINNPLF
jgi:hypothetical protein